MQKLRKILSFNLSSKLTMNLNKTAVLLAQIVNKEICHYEQH